MQRLAAVLRVVQDDVEDCAAEGQGRAISVNKGVFQALLVAHLAPRFAKAA